jgi:glycosyltransferase involved in cell wall biosynthesis
MIVKNEANVIKRCLDSVKDIIDTWCIVDTGSTDGTQQIIKETLNEIPGKLIESKWVNFGYNRTEAYEYAKNMADWALLIDADMVINNLGFEKNQLSNEIGSYTLIQKNESLTYRNIRLINLNLTWKCIGVTHEYWQSNSKTGIQKNLTTLEIIDIGDGGSKSDKFTRDMALLIKGIQDEPHNARYKFYLAQSYKDIGDYSSSIPWYEACSRESKWEEEVWYSEYMKLKCMIELKYDSKHLEAQAMHTWLIRPWRAEPIYLLSKEIKDWTKKYYILKLCSNIDYPKDDVLFIEYNIYEGEILDELAVAAYWLDKTKESIEILDRLILTNYGNKTKERLLVNREFAVKKANSLYQ